MYPSRTPANTSAPCSTVSNTYVDVKWTGGVSAPSESAGSYAAWIARVENPILLLCRCTTTSLSREPARPQNSLLSCLTRSVIILYLLDRQSSKGVDDESPGHCRNRAERRGRTQLPGAYRQTAAHLY